MPKLNPYNNKNMLPHDSEMFFGRADEMRRVEAMLRSDNPQCVSIIGERRIGKSSLANRVYHRLREAEKVVPVFLDCGGLEDGCDTRGDFFGELSDRFSEFQERLWPDDYELFSDYSSFKRFVRKEAKAGFRFVIFMDEFEKLPEMKFADDSFFSNLRALANNPDYQLAFVTVSQHSLKEMVHHDAIKSSEFWNIFSTEVLGLLDECAIVDLRTCGFRKNKLPLDEAEILIIDHYAGAFPFFNQIVCSRVFDAKVAGAEADRDGLEVMLMDFYEKLWASRSREEQKLLKDLDDEKVQARFAVKQMAGRGLLRKVSGRYYPFSKFFGELIRRRFKIESALKKPTFKDVKGILKEANKTFSELNKIKKGAQNVLPNDSQEEPKQK